MNKTILIAVPLAVLVLVISLIGTIHTNKSDIAKGGASIQTSSGLSMQKVDVPKVKDISKYGLNQSENDFAQAILDGYKPVVASGNLTDVSNLYIATAMKMGVLVSSNFKNGQMNLYDLIRN